MPDMVEAAPKTKHCLTTLLMCFRRTERRKALPSLPSELAEELVLAYLRTHCNCGINLTGYWRTLGFGVYCIKKDKNSRDDKEERLYFVCNDYEEAVLVLKERCCRVLVDEGVLFKRIALGVGPVVVTTVKNRMAHNLLQLIAVAN